MSNRYRTFHFDCRLKRTESVQFFQFDSHGNMFMYPPGAGCSGEPTFVPPGEELFIPNSTNVKVETSFQQPQCLKSLEKVCEVTPVCSDNVPVSSRYMLLDG